MEQLKQHTEPENSERKVIKTDLENLHIYKQARLALAAQLRIVREGLKALGRNEAEKQCKELMVKLAEDRFILGVLGQFKRGKSSLMNAIIGEDILPTGVLPLTSAITILKYGPAKKIIINREGSLFPEEAPVSALAEYVTANGNPDNQKNVKTVTVELPVSFLRTGIEFVDTPGVGSAFKANTDTTYNFLPECDAVLFVTSVDTPMTSIELDFLKEIREYVNKIFFVVNKIDLVSDSQKDEVLEFVIQTIRTQIESDLVKVFAISSSIGLEARESGDAALYEKSGLKALEDALADFLSGEKTATFLAAVVQKLLRILENEKTQNTFSEEALQAREKFIQKEKPIMHFEAPHDSAQAINEAQTTLEVLYKNLLDNQLSEIARIEIKPFKNVTKSETFLVDPEPKTFDVSKLTEEYIAKDLQTDSCPVCRHIAKSEFDFFAHWQYQLSNSEEAQQGFAEELGFCPLHTWQLLSISSFYGVSVGYSKLFEQIAGKLKVENIDSNTGEKIRRMVRNSQNCRVCKLLSQIETEYIHRLSEIIDTAEGRSKYNLSQGSCLRHLGLLLDIVLPENKSFLLLHSARRFEQDTEDMRSFAMKRDALRRSLLNREEEDAYLRSIIRFVGDKSVCAPWSGDGEI